MKRKLFVFSFGLACCLFFATSSCSRGYGCPSFDQKPKSEKKAKKGGKSSLFPKGVYRN